jgi:hypothetical protein
MGVPVVTLAGDRHASRVGTSLLSAIGLHSCIATDPDDYVLAAGQLAASPQLLVAMRNMLRPGMAASPLCDAGGLARAFTAAIGELWAEWCSRRAENIQPAPRPCEASTPAWAADPTFAGGEWHRIAPAAAPPAMARTECVRAHPRPAGTLDERRER